MEKLDIHSPLQLRNGHQLKNRVVVPPMASTTADHLGFVTPKTEEHYRRLTKSRAGLVIVEYSYVHDSGKSEPNQLGAASCAHLGGLKSLATIIHQGGAMAGLQLSHGGGKSSRELTSGAFMGPSGIAVPVKDAVLETPAEMTPGEVELWKHSFVEAALLAREACFDLIEVHSAHGYGLNQFLSPITNRRPDDYGNDRARLLIEIVSEIRRLVPELLVSVRMPGQDFLESGLTVAETSLIAQELEVNGVDLLHISSGIGGWRRPSFRTGEGYLVAEAAAIQSKVSIPVIGVGGIETAGYINRGLGRRDFSLATVGRAILKDPEAWYENQLAPRRQISHQECFANCP